MHSVRSFRGHHGAEPILPPSPSMLLQPSLLTRAVPPSFVRNKTSSSAAPSVNPRWLSEIKHRIGKCILFGLKPHQTAQAGKILRDLAQDWRALSVGSEGFLTARERTSIFRHAVVWGEMDSMGHVNNVVYNRYSESGRVAWIGKFATHTDAENRKQWMDLMTPKGTGLILRSITTDFKFPMKWPDHITIYHKLRNEPTTDSDAFILDVIIISEQHQRPAARLVEDIVIYDYRKAGKAVLPPFMLNAFRETWLLQEEAKRTNRRKVGDITEKVRRLEQESWDREDAVEDMGSADKRHSSTTGVGLSYA